MPDPTYDLFISYSRRDRAWVHDWLLPRLRDAGLRVCIDTDSFDIGVPSLVNMERAVANSRHTLIILTPAWLASEWTELQALLVQTADHAARRRRLLPIVLADLTASPPPARIAMLTYADFRDPAVRAAQLARLIATIQGKLNLPELGPQLRELLLPAPALHTLRPPTPDFTGRATDIAVLVAHLSQDSATAAITGIRGMGGIGKTELALAVSQVLASEYPDAALMFELQPGDRPLSIEALLTAIIHAFQPERQLPDALPDLQAIYRATLSNQCGLLLLDNAAGPDQVRPLLPPPSGWAVIVTSRARFPLPGACPYDLNLLPLTEAVDLLTRILSDSGRHDLVPALGLQPPTSDPLAALAERCGRLPLALRLAAGFLATYPDWVLADYLAALDQARLKHLTAPGEPSLQAVLGLSITRLRELDPALADRWEQLAVFPAPFDRTAAAVVWGTLDAPLHNSINAWPQPAPLPDDETHTALSTLIQQSLLDYTRAADAYSLHDLLREYILAVPNLELNETRQRHAWHYLRLGREAENCYQQGGELMVAGLRQFEKIWPHLAAAWAWQRVRADEMARRWVNSYPLSLLERSGRGFYVTAEYKSADVRYREALALATALDVDPRRIAELYCLLGAIAYNMGQTSESLGYLDQGLAVLQQYGIPTDRLAIELQADRVSMLAELGEFGLEESVLAYSKLLAEAAELEPSVATTSTIAMIHNYRGTALGDLGRILEGVSDYRRAVELYEEVGDWRMAGTCSLNLAATAYWCMHPEDVDEPLTKGIEYSEKVGDRGNLNWAKSLRGSILLLQDHAAESKQILLEAIVEAEEWDLGWDLVGMYTELAAARLSLGHPVEAREAALRAIDLAAHDSDPTENGWAYTEYGRAESVLGNHAAAEIYLQKALDLHHQAEQRHYTARTQGYLGQALLKAGQVHRGVANLTEAIATLEDLQLHRVAEFFRKSLREAALEA